MSVSRYLGRRNHLPPDSRSRQMSGSQPLGRNSRRGGVRRYAASLV